MRRRAFVAALGSAAAWPLVGRAQTSSKIARIGFLGVGPASAWTSQTTAFRAGLRDGGRIESKNIVMISAGQMMSINCLHWQPT